MLNTKLLDYLHGEGDDIGLILELDGPVPPGLYIARAMGSVSIA